MKIVLTGGGTAGHIFPAISLGLYMKETYGCKVYYIGKKNSLEEKIAKQNGIPFYSVSSSGLNKKAIVSFVAKNTVGTVEAMKILKKIEPNYIFSTGGYVSAPTIAAASLLGIPYAIHEQNAITGKVNKLFAKNAKLFFHSFPAIERKNVCYSGNPVRFQEKLKQNGDKILFLGGSGGSDRINQFALSFAKENPKIKTILVAGEKRYQKVLMEVVPDNLEVIKYADDVLKLYKRAKIVVCRSGSGTLFELATLQIPSILVPLPTSADDHQKKNALYFVEKEAALMEEEDDSFYESLTMKIFELYDNQKKRETLKGNMGILAKTDSVKIIAERIMKGLKT